MARFVRNDSEDSDFHIGRKWSWKISNLLKSQGRSLSLTPFSFCFDAWSPKVTTIPYKTIFWIIIPPIQIRSLFIYEGSLYASKYGTSLIRIKILALITTPYSQIIYLRLNYLTCIRWLRRSRLSGRTLSKTVSWTPVVFAYWQQATTQWVHNLAPKTEGSLATVQYVNDWRWHWFRDVQPKVCWICVWNGFI